MKSITRLKPECIRCVIEKQLERYPKGISEQEKVTYMQNVLEVIANATGDTSAPVLVRDIAMIQKKMFGTVMDYSREKKYYNQLMLEKEGKFKQDLIEAEDELGLAIRYAMMANYIDFGALKDVDETELNRFFEEAKEIVLDNEIVTILREELINAKRIVYITDNCGEIVADKLFLEVIKSINPNGNITALVRGKPVLNDATIEDAIQVGLHEVVKVMENGSDIAGTSMTDISKEALCLLEEADVIIAKGQGNFETLQQCGKNIYYIFMCKCAMFAEMFHVPLYSGMLIKEKTKEEKE